MGISRRRSPHAERQRIICSVRAPFMSSLERKGVIAAGSPEAIRQAVDDVPAKACERYILAADCTVPSETPWENLKTASNTADQY